MRHSTKISGEKEIGNAEKNGRGKPVLVQWPNSRILFRMPTIRARCIHT